MQRFTLIKKSFMKYIWRFQQSQAFVSIIFWSLALAGIFYERSSWYFNRYLGMSADPDQQVATKTLILMLLVVLLVVMFGFLYDTIFRLWEQQNIVNQERNVFSQYKINVRDLIMHRNLYIPILKSVNTGEFDEQVAFMNRWITKILTDDAIATMYYNHITDWVKSDNSHWKAPGMDKLLTAQKNHEKYTLGK
jgi:hypothetical protein